ncbi:hypothetical protein N9Z86_00810 [bacterium]|nr:hypothetical protein [bacterium]
MIVLTLVPLPITLHATPALESAPELIVIGPLEANTSIEYCALEGVGVIEGVLDGVLVTLGVLEGVLDGVLVTLGVLEGVLEGVLDGVEVTVGVTEGVTEGVLEGEGVGQIQVLKESKL